MYFKIGREIMIDGIITPALRDFDYLAPSAPYPATPSGLLPHQNTIYRYSIPTDEQPILTIENYIADYNGNFIAPGHYQLALSNDKEFLYIIESKDLIAIIPVFKLEENKNEVNKLYEQNKPETFKQKIEKLKNSHKEKINEIIKNKYAQTGATPPQKYEYCDATIEYIKDKQYYLLKYEKGYIRAWGAIKINQ